MVSNFIVVQWLTCVQLFATSRTVAHQSSSVLPYLLNSAQTHVHWVSVASQPSHVMLSPSLLPSVYPRIRVFSSESALASGSQRTGASATASALPVNFQGWLPLWWTGLISLLSMESKGLSRVFSSTRVQKYQFLCTQPCLQSNSQICTWLLKKPQFWLYGPLLAKWYLCFLICCLRWS